MPEAARWRLRPAAGSGWRARAGYPTRRGREGRRLDLLAPGGGSSGEARAREGGAVEAPPLPPLSPAVEREREESGPPPSARHTTGRRSGALAHRMDGDGGAERGVTALAVLNEEGGAVACGAVEWTERSREWRWKGLGRLPSNHERTCGYSRCEWRVLKSIAAGSQKETCLFQLSNSDS